MDQISKITPISDLLNYKGCLSVECQATSNIRQRKEKKNFCRNIEYLRSILRVGGGIKTVPEMGVVMSHDPLLKTVKVSILMRLVTSLISTGINFLTFTLLVKGLRTKNY